MAKFSSLFILFVLLMGKTFSQVKEYKLYDKSDSADINWKLAFLLDDAAPGMTMLENVFKPVKGKFTVYRFLATFEGFSFTKKKKQFHDIIILKTDGDNKIIRAYQYTLEWAEMPMESDLYRNAGSGVLLRDDMSIDQLLFERPWHHDKDDRKLKDSAVIRLFR